MKKILFSAACLMLPLSTWSQGPAIRPIPKSPIPSTSPPGHLKTVLTSYEGYIEIQKAGQDARERVISVPQTLRGGDRVHTYKKGSAVIQFKDGSQVRLGPYTIFTVEEDTPAKISLNITLGRLWAVVAKVRSREFQVQTPTAVAAVRGTTFGVEVFSPSRTSVMVAEGQVGVRGMAGDELLLNANQRVEVLQDRMTRPERFEGKPEGMREETGDSKEEDEEGDSKGSKGDREHGDKMRQAMEREVGFQLGRDAIESAAAFEMKNAIYEEGKTVIDVFGKRVRVEEYITRPDPATFKFVTLNFRDDRLDHSFLEVVANRPLPQDLGLMGNLWFHHTPNPEWYAVKQRWVISNTQDSLVHLMVDGSPQESRFMSSLGPVRFYPTVFGNVYEFINGDPVALNKIWSENYRPFSSTLEQDYGLRAAASLMIHAQPILMAERCGMVAGCGDFAFNAEMGNKWWDYAPITFNGALGSTGKFSFDHGFAPEPGLAHFVRIRHFINFVDTNSNGILDFGEYSDGKVYHDKVARITNGAPLPGSLTDVVGKGGYDATGDRDFFSDLNNNNVLDLNPLVEPKLQAVNYSLFEPEIFFRELMMKVAKESRDWLREDHFTFNDEGKVIDFRALSASADTQEGMQNIFETLNFERVITSSKFEGRKIDLVTTPHFMMEAGMLHHEPPHDDVGDVQKTPGQI